MKEGAFATGATAEKTRQSKIAHDLNNVMMIVGNSAEMILEVAGDNPQLRKVGERLQRAAERGTALAAELGAPEKNR